MKQILSILVGVLCLGSLALAVDEAPEGESIPIEISSDGENRIVGDVATAEVNVVVRYGTDVIYADKISFDRKTRVVMASGNVRIYAADKIYRGETIVYNFDTQAVQSTDFRVSNLPVFAGGEKVTTPAPGHYRLKNGFFTTSNQENPGFKLKAETIELYPDDAVVLKNVVLYAGDVPLMWIPIVAQSLDDERPNFVVDGGSNTRFGAFAKMTYNWFYDKNMRGAVHFDSRSRRGFAGGLDLQYKPNKNSIGLFRGYYAQDNDPNFNPTSQQRGSTSDSRYRFALQQKTYLTDGLSTTVDLNVWSDQHITEDFFEREFREERMPDNMVEAMQYNENFTVSLLIREHINEYFDSVERSPELKIEGKRQKIFNSPIAYESEYSMGSYTYKNADPSNLPDYGSYRWDTLQQILYPRQYMNWLNFTPRLGVRGTAWSDGNFTTPGDKNEEPQKRVVGIAGAEASFKVSKTWLDVQDQRLGIDGLRHVAEPFINAQYIPDADVDPTRIRGFDKRLPSTRLQPINQTAYNSIDSIDRQAVARHGVRNKLQTKRDGQNYDLVDWAVFADADMARNADLDPQRRVNDNIYSNIYSELEFRPLPWLTYSSYSSFGISGNSFDETNNEIRWQMTRSFEAGIGNRYLNNCILYPDSNLAYLSTFYRMNEHWQFETIHSFESDDGTLQEQTYRIYRDLSAWQLALTYTERDHRSGQDEQMVYFTLTLKAFPSQKLSLNSP